MNPNIRDDGNCRHQFSCDLRFWVLPFDKRDEADWADDERLFFDSLSTAEGIGVNSTTDSSATLLLSNINSNASFKPWYWLSAMLTVQQQNANKEIFCNPWKQTQFKNSIDWIIFNTANTTKTQLIIRPILTCKQESWVHAAKTFLQ